MNQFKNLRVCSLFFLLGLVATGGFGQDRCSIVPGPGCIDFDLTTSDTLRVPLTTTRIERDAVKVCVGGSQSSTPVDVVFVMDQSGSMDDTDGSYYADDALSGALTLLNSLTIGSNVGMVAFSGSICAQQALSPLNATSEATMQTWVDNNIADNNNELSCNAAGGGTGGTNYLIALQTADSILQLSTAANKAIIFITDGEPCGPGNPCNTSQWYTEYQNWTGKSALDPVYSIFIGGDSTNIGDPTSRNGRLNELSTLTGGGFFPIAANDNDALENVFNNVVNLVTDNVTISQTVVTNITNSSTNTVTGGNHVGSPPKYTANMSNVISLQEGLNVLRVTTTAVIGSVPTTKTEDVPIIVEGTQTGLDTLFNLQCQDASSIVAMNAGFNNAITSIDFDATSFGVRLTTSDTGISSTTDNLTTGGGDSETFTLAESGNFLQHLVNMSLAPIAANNQSIQVTGGGDSIVLYWQHPGDPRDNARYVLPVVDNRPPLDIDHAWIKDLDADGSAETVYIKFASVPEVLPTSIPLIDWPGDASDTRINQTNISYLEGDSTVIVIDVSGNPFAQGITSAVPGGAFLTLPNEAYYVGRQVPIDDSIGAVIVEIEKVPSSFTQYLQIMPGGDTVVVTLPDTLIVSFSEVIVPGGGVEPWTNLIVYLPDGDSIWVNVEILGEPTIISDDSLTWRIIVPAGTGNSLQTGDIVKLNPNSSYTDLTGNKNNPVEEPTTGKDGSSNGLISQVFRNVVGNIDPNDPKYTISLIDQGPMEIRGPNGEILGTVGRDVSIIDWIPPVGLASDGTIDLNIQKNCASSGTTVQDNIVQAFPENCVSAIMTLAKEPYQAKIEIYDHLGKYINSDEQWFGYCGELDNRERIAGLEGSQSFLVWNQKDSEDQYVGSGVYVVKVLYKFEGGRSRTMVYKQGIARANDPTPNCAQP